MSKTITTARIRADGKVVKMSKGGTETPFPETLLRPMTEAQVRAAAHADPDARPTTGEELRKAKRIPYVKTLRRALGFTQEEFAARYQIPLARFGIGSRGGLSLISWPGLISRSSRAIRNACTGF
jgi:putative transcriptional regulator